MSSTGTAVDVVMPQMGVSVSEGTITKWSKQVGEQIEADETLLEISTDKVDTEVPSPAAGIVTEILVPEGETVAVGTVLARIGGEAGAAAPAPVAAPPAPEPAAPPAAPAEPSAPVAAEPGPPTERETEGNGRSFVSPVVARIASEHNIDPTQVPGTGTGGRVTKKDIQAFIEAGPPEVAAPEAPAETPAPAPASAPPVVQAQAAAPAASGDPAPGESFEPMSAMRRGIAEHMRRSLDTSAHVTSAIEVDMSKVVSIREKLKKEYPPPTASTRPTSPSSRARRPRPFASTPM